MKWAVVLSKFDTEYQARISLQSQVLADFIVKLILDLPTMRDNSEDSWVLMVDTNVKGSGIGVYLRSPQEEIIE